MIETKGRKTVKVAVEEFAALLQIDVARVAADKLEGRVNARLVGIGLGVACGRCGGSGSYSYNQRDGSRCYGCEGQRYVMAKLTEAYYEQVKVALADGCLEKYLEDLARRTKIEKADKALMTFVSASEIAKDYSAEYARERQEDGAERRRVDALAREAGLEYASGQFFTDNYNKAAAVPMNPIIKELRFAQSAIHKEYEHFLLKLMKEKRYGLKVGSELKPLPTPEETSECEALLYAKYENVLRRLEEQEAGYKHLKQFIRGQ